MNIKTLLLTLSLIACPTVQAVWTDYLPSRTVVGYVVDAADKLEQDAPENVRMFLVPIIAAGKILVFGPLGLWRVITRCENTPYVQNPR